MRDDATPDRRASEADHPRGRAVPAPGSSASAVVPGGAASSATEWKAPASPRRSMAALVALAACAFLIVTNEIAPLGLIRLMAADLGRSESEIGFVTTAFALVVMIVTVPLTLVTTKLPRRPLIVATMVLFSVGVLVIATADSFAQLLGGRMITAVGHALFWAVVAPASAGMFPPEVRGRSVTRLLLGATGAGVIGLPMATWLAQQTDWRLPFWIIGIASLVLAVAVAALMPNFRTEESSVPRGDVPSLRRFIRVLAVVILTTVGMSTTWTFITPFLVEVAGFAESAVPVLLAISGVTGVVSMWLAGRVLDRWPVRSVAVGQAGLLVLWLGLATLGHIQAVAIAMLLLQGLAWSLTVASMLNWTLRHTPWPSDIGAGAQASTFNAGNAVGSVLGAGMLAWWGAQWLPLASAVMSAAALAIVLTAAPDAMRVLARRGGRRRG